MGKKKRKQRERPKQRSRLEAIRAWLKTNRDLFKAYGVFVLFIVIAFSLLVTPWGRVYFLVPLNELIAYLSAFLLNLFGTSAQASSTRIVSSITSVHIQEGCNGIYATVIFLAGIVAFPTSLKKKLIGVIFGTIVIFMINLVRVITLFYLSAYYPSLFDEAHLYIWQFAIIIAGGILWLVWYDKVVNRPVAASGL